MPLQFLVILLLTHTKVTLLAGSTNWKVACNTCTNILMRLKCLNFQKNHTLVNVMFRLCLGQQISWCFGQIKLVIFTTFLLFWHFSCVMTNRGLNRYDNHNSANSNCIIRNERRVPAYYVKVCRILTAMGFVQFTFLSPKIHVVYKNLFNL